MRRYRLVSVLIFAVAYGLVDTVLSVRQDRGILVVRLTRFTVHVPLSMNGRPEIAQGSTVGLRAAPGAVCVLVTDTAIRGTGRVI